jgi:hypothetical protein
MPLHNAIHKANVGSGSAAKGAFGRMSLADRRLVRHLVIAVLVKLAALTALWWWFVRDIAVSVDADRAAIQMVPVAGSSRLSRGPSSDL